MSRHRISKISVPKSIRLGEPDIEIDIGYSEHIGLTMHQAAHLADEIYKAIRKWDGHSA